MRRRNPDSNLGNYDNLFNHKNMKSKNFPDGLEELRLIFRKSGLPMRFLDTEFKDLNFSQSEWEKKKNEKSLQKLETYLNGLELNLENGKNIFIASDDVVLGDAIATCIAKEALLILRKWNFKLGLDEAIRQKLRIFYLSFLKLQDLLHISQFDSEAKTRRNDIFNSKILIFSSFDSLAELRGEDTRILIWLEAILRERSLNLKPSMFVSSTPASVLIEQKSLKELIATACSNSLKLNFHFNHEKKNS